MKTGHLYTIAIFCVAFLISPFLHAQPSINMGFVYSRPIGDLRAANYDDGLGFSLVLFRFTGAQTTNERRSVFYLWVASNICVDLAGNTKILDPNVGGYAIV